MPSNKIKSAVVNRDEIDVAYYVSASSLIEQRKNLKKYAFAKAQFCIDVNNSNTPFLSMD